MPAPDQLHADLPTFDPWSQGFFDDPYPHYAELRARNPVQVDARGTAFCFAYDDVRTLLVDSRLTSMDRERSAPEGETRLPPPTFPLALLNRDPPDHTRLRKLMSSTFTPRKLERLMESMAALVDQLLDDLDHQYRETGEPVDLVPAVTFPFPFRVISAMLGMPDADDSQLKRWAHDISVASDPIVTRARVARAVAAYQAINEYVGTEVLPWKRRNRSDDLLSHLLAAEDEGALSKEELLDNVALLYVAGHETTSGLIGNAILNLLRHRDQLELLRAEPGLLANAIEELNRYESSIQLAWRYVIDDFPLRDGIVLSRGTMAFVCCGSANRDPDHFGDTADRLDITRADAKDSLSFGNGLHFCLGAHLARREAALVIGRVLERFPDLGLAGEAPFVPRATFRALAHLPVVLS
jgi:cytochrome P450